ncbi:hypothetical protein ACIBW9_05460 [Streptomyces sp. NPDC049541]|uniref:hypothetical protein n=1 Tax=Streptomyces sp. NPDC049541 TaxID=3365594 RepID=UPI0037A22202
MDAFETLSVSRTQGERLWAAQPSDKGGLEVQAGARIVWEAWRTLLHVFIAVGQYLTQRDDYLAATYEAEVQQLVAQAG